MRFGEVPQSRNMQILFLSTATHKLGVAWFREEPQSRNMQIPFLSTATYKLGVACVSGKCRKEKKDCLFQLYHVKLDHHWH